MPDDWIELISGAGVDLTAMTEGFFLSRQPIFDCNERVWGYALLAHADPRCSPARMEEKKAARPDDQAYWGMVLEKLAGGRRVLINYPDTFFLQEDSLPLPREMVVLEVSPEMPVGEELLAACRHFREQGHLLALGNSVWPAQKAHPLMEQVDVLKIPYPRASPSKRPELHLAFPKLKLLACGIENREDFRQAANQGFHLFQGRFYTKPEVISRGDIPKYKLNFVKLLNELGRTTLDFQKLEKLIEGNPTLLHKLLKYINSAFFGLSFQVASIGQALLLLGEQEIRKWAALAIIHHLGQDQPEEVLRLSLLRAHFGEFLASRSGLQSQAPELVLVGLLSLLDVYMGRPLTEVLNGIPLAPLIKETLLGGATPYRPVFDLVLAHERAEGDQVSTLAGRLGLTRDMTLTCYLEAIDEGQKAIQFWTR
jgi:EAL and modified HD-GYP domain-containing signal transduction protein